MNVKFEDMENYLVFTKMNPDVYGFVDVTALIGKVGAKSVFRLKRTVQYQASFSSIRDRMFAGLTCIYDKMYEMFGQTQKCNGELKNYFAVAIETGNDIPRKTLSFDIHLIQSQSYQALLTSKEFNAIPNINEEKLHKAVFAFGYQYSKDIESIGLTDKIFHFKVYKDDSGNLRSYDLGDEFTFSAEDENCLAFIDGCFYGTDRSTYYIGLNMTPKEDNVNMNIEDDDEMVVENLEKAIESSEDELELMDLDEFLGSDKNVDIDPTKE